jgi:hypothetical protein
LYRYYEFILQTTEAILKNLFKLGGRLEISPVKIWDRKNLIDAETRKLKSFSELGEMSALNYKLKQDKMVEPKEGRVKCSNCRQYRILGDYSKKNNGQPKKTCDGCSRKRK